ncbi:hypothetical protein K8S17_04000 [bacterium]|nr:hypothetical protein [bacterium]
MKKLVIVAVALLFVTTAFASQTLNYSWEDGATILGQYGSLCCDTNVSGAQLGSQGSALPDYTCPGAVDGTYYLHVAEDPHDGTPQAFVCWVTGLTDGDVVDAMFYGYDITAGASPSLRIWGSYTAVGGTIDDYAGSAGGNDTYTAGTGWDLVSHTWTYDSDLGSRDGLNIHARLYSSPTTSDPDHTDYWIDDITVTAPDHAVIHFPEPMSPVEEGTWGSIKALYR